MKIKSKRLFFLISIYALMCQFSCSYGLNFLKRFSLKNVKNFKINCKRFNTNKNFKINEFSDLNVFEKENIRYSANDRCP